MKYLVLIGDGMADYPLESIGGRTPLEAAHTPAMDSLAREGIVGAFYPIPEGFSPGSDIGNLSLFGYDPTTHFTGRAPLEAARHGIRLRADQVAFRCNLVTLQNGTMASFTSEHISTEEADQLIRALGQALSRYPVSFHTGVSYRHLALIDGEIASVDALSSTQCTPPHDISDQEYAPYLPSGPAADILRELMAASRDVLGDHPVNETRRDRGKLPATSIWLWGQGKAPALETYESQYGISGAVVSAVDLVKGIGICAGLEVIDVAGATGYLDTNYAGKVAAALDALDRHDFVYLHVEAPDETAHEGRTDRKIQAIEDFDRNVVAPCREYALRRGDCRILVAPDHITAISTRTHAGGPVPFVLTGAGVDLNAPPVYSESAAAASRLTVHRGHRLVPHLIEADHISAGSLDALDEGVQAGPAEYA